MGIVPFGKREIDPFLVSVVEGDVGRRKEKGLVDPSRTILLVKGRSIPLLGMKFRTGIESYGKEKKKNETDG